jgi:hypothetical protein
MKLEALFMREVFKKVAAAGGRMFVLRGAKGDRRNVTDRLDTAGAKYKAVVYGPHLYAVADRSCKGFAGASPLEAYTGLVAALHGVLTQPRKKGTQPIFSSPEWEGPGRAVGELRKKYDVRGRQRKRPNAAAKAALEHGGLVEPWSRTGPGSKVRSAFSIHGLHGLPPGECLAALADITGDEDLVQAAAMCHPSDTGEDGSDDLVEGRPASEGLEPNG